MGLYQGLEDTVQERRGHFHKISNTGTFLCLQKFTSIVQVTQRRDGLPVSFGIVFQYGLENAFPFAVTGQVNAWMPAQKSFGVVIGDLRSSEDRQHTGILGLQGLRNRQGEADVPYVGAETNDLRGFELFHGLFHANAVKHGRQEFKSIGGLEVSLGVGL